MASLKRMPLSMMSEYCASRPRTLKRISLKRYEAILLNRSFDEESFPGSACMSDTASSSDSAKTAPSTVENMPVGTITTDLRSSDSMVTSTSLSAARPLRETTLPRMPPSCA